MRGPVKGPLDLTPIVSDPKNITLVGDYGVAFFVPRHVGVYEFHAAVVPHARGQWAAAAGRSVLRWMFGHTDAAAIFAPIPQPNRAARNLVVYLGFRLQHVSPAAWPDGAGQRVPLHIYTLFRRDWGVH